VIQLELFHSFRQQSGECAKLYQAGVTAILFGRAGLSSRRAVTCIARPGCH
jgi:hypothetical protein